MLMSDWPNCKVEGCLRKCCLALNSPFCFPHTPGNKHINSLKIDVANVVASKQESENVE